MLYELFGDEEPKLDLIIKAIRTKIEQGKITPKNFYEEVGIYFVELEGQVDKMRLSDEDLEKFENEIDKIWDEVTLNLSTLQTRLIQSENREGLDRKNLTPND